MAKRKYDEDLFESTKMTFGEHLEELRKCFFKGGIGLALGMVIGLIFATDVVRFIQTPLTGALETHYRERSKAKLKEYAKVHLGGEQYAPPDVLARLDEGEYLFDMVLCDVDDMRRRLDLSAPAAPTLPDVEVDPQRDDEADEAFAERKRQRQYEAIQESLPELKPVFLWRRVADDSRITLKSLSSEETFMIWLKAGFVVGAMISSPWVFYQVWVFVAAGLYPHERHYVYVFLPFSLALFFSGAALAFFVVFRFVLKFLLGFNASMGIDPDPRISEWLSFVILLPLGFGIAFQLPLVMLFLQRIGIMSIELYLSKWRIAVLVMACLSAVLSPGGDPYSMLFMFIPLVGLYFLGIGLCRYMPRNTDTDEELMQSMA
ncbi:MAG: twin-arginine translocase subunit TatC [Planctomycetota bacterium]|nr:MAG: twin-arginine translocase subunit TatC [Planctomycetota bacterium]